MDEVPAHPQSADEAVAEQLRGCLIGLVKLLRGQLEELSAQRGLTAPQSLAMFQLGHAASIPMRDLAGRLHFDPSYVTSLADGLEEHGLAERRPHPEDRRVKLLVLTEHGAEVRADLVAALNRDMPGLDALDPQERHSLLDMLQRMMGAAGGSLWGNC